MTIRYHDAFEQAEEIWAVVDGFPDYAVSDRGNVKRIVDRHRSRAGHVMKQSLTFGYRYVYLTVGGKVRACRVHRLVCRAFHGPAPTPSHHAAHNDGRRDNNLASNIRWATASENMRDKSLHGTAAVGTRNGSYTCPDRRPRGERNGKRTKPEATPRGEAHGCSRLTESDVRAIRADSRSRRAIAAAYGVSKCAVDGVKTGKTWSHVQ